MIDADDKDDLIEVIESCIYRLAAHYEKTEFRARVTAIVEDAISDVESEND